MYCMKCGQEMNENSILCSNCGMNLETVLAQGQLSEAVADQEIVQKKSRKLLEITAVAAVLMIGLFLYKSVFGGYDRLKTSGLNDQDEGYLSEANCERTEEIMETEFPIQSAENLEDINASKDIDSSEAENGEGYKEQSITAYLEQASEYVQIADYEKALEIYDVLLELDREDAQVQGDTEDCLTEYIDQLIADQQYDKVEVLIGKYGSEVQGVDLQIYLEEILERDAATEIGAELLTDRTESGPATITEITESGTETESETITYGTGEEELFASVPAFDITDITIMGYDLSKPHIGEVAAALGYSNGTEQLSDSGRIYVSDYNIALDSMSDDQSYYSSIFIYSYESFDGGNCSLFVRKLNGKETNEGRLGESWCSIPISMGDSYEWWCEQIGVNVLRESPIVGYECDEWTNGDGKTYSYFFWPYDRDVRINYTEYRYAAPAWYGDWYEYDMQIQFYIKREDGSSLLVIAFFLNDTVQSVKYIVYH